MKHLLLFSLACLTASAAAQTPNVIFHDDFSNPSFLDTGTEPGGIGVIAVPNETIWGENSLEMKDYENQIIRVTDADSENLFGEADNNYLEIRAHGNEGQESSWILAADRFSSASEVITVSLRFNDPGTSGDNGPRLRVGTGNTVQSANAARQDAQFEGGDFSGYSNIYGTGEPNLLELVYNNSEETIRYLDGRVALPSDAYDVWINGDLAVKDARRGIGQLPVGTALSSLTFIVYGEDQNHLYIDDVTVYDGPYVANPNNLPDIPEEGVLFADDFSNPEADGAPSFLIWGTNAIRNYRTPDVQNIYVTSEGSEQYFGEANNNYLYMQSPGGDLGNSLWITANNRFQSPSKVVTVSLDFFRSASAPGNEGPTMRVGVEDPMLSNSNRTRYHFRFENDALSGGRPGIENNRLHHIEWVYNNSEEDVTYAQGTATVPSNSYDVWVDGELIHSGLQYFGHSSAIALGEPMTSWGLGVIGSVAFEMRIDNLKIYEGARVSGTAGLTFETWADAEGIPENQRGFEDDPAGDGIANLVKYALGLPALTPSRADLPTTQRVAQNGEEYLALEFLLPPDRSGVELRLQGAEKLGEWIDLDATLEFLDADAGNGQLVRFLDTEPLSAHDRRFLRLRVDLIE